MKTKITIKVLPVCSGSAGGKKASCVFSGNKQLGYIQPTNCDNPIGGGPAFEGFIAVQQIQPYGVKACSCYDEALKFFGINYPTTNDIEYPEGIYDEFQKNH